jgi:hypothetical protein
MRDNREKWMELCEQAADEQDPKKLAALILQINYILEAKELRLIEAAVIRQSAKTESVLMDHR